MPEPDERPSPRRGTRQPWLFAAVLGTLVLALAAGLLARGWYVQPARVTAVPAPRPPSAPAAEPPGSPTVALSADAAAHPNSGPVRRVLQSYFDAINAGDYDQWIGAVTAERAAGKARAQWQREFGSTRDGSIAVYRIERAGPSALRVLLSFASTQHLRDAPQDFQHRCIRWRAVFPLAVENGAWRLDAGPTGAFPQHDTC